MVHRINEFAAKQEERCAIVKFDVVEWVRNNLGHPHESSLDVLQEEKVDGAE